MYKILRGEKLGRDKVRKREKWPETEKKGRKRKGQKKVILESKEKMGDKRAL